jgi:hypothetical protein
MEFADLNQLSPVGTSCFGFVKQFGRFGFGLDLQIPFRAYEIFCAATKVLRS